MDTLVGSFIQMAADDYQSLLRLSSTVEAISINSGEMPFTTVKKVQSKLDEVVIVLPDVLSTLTFADVSNFVQRFARTSVKLMEVSHDIPIYIYS